MKAGVRELEAADIDYILDYFLNADHTFLRAMGVDPQKLPERQVWDDFLREDLLVPIEQRKLYFLVWEIGEQPVGHSNLNNIVFGDRANMHLHLWEAGRRRKGNGSYFIRQSISRYFQRFQLQKLYCEPYAHNPAPNRTLKRVGFDFVKQYETVPGGINFRQPVNCWLMLRERWQALSKSRS